jgi:hypothetical protein
MRTASKILLAVLSAVPVTMLSAACVSSSSTPNPASFDGGQVDAAGFDASGLDTGTPLPDAGGNDGGPSDTGLPDAGATYNDMTQPAFWSGFDITTVDANAKGFEGAVFDGRYLYLIPYAGGGGIVARYDTQATFADKASWAVFNTTTVDPNANGFAGGTFDGRYLYLAPRHGLGNVVARYDTQAAFGDKASWSSFTTTTADPAASGFVGATYDGRYVYFVPYNNAANVYHGVVTRYDTQGTFTDKTAWLTYDTAAQVAAGAKGFYGGVFDGRYLYFVPWITSGTPSTTYGSLVTRYDTQAAFTTKASWATFDTVTRDPAAKGFSGGAFDGRYLYLVPAAGSVAARFDTTADFATTASWQTYDVSKVKTGAAGFTGATFDGRYVYFAPYSASTYDGLVARYDITAAFDAPTSWSTYDTTGTNTGALGFIGTAFDGRYVYMVPCTSGTFHGEIVRFDAKLPASMPVLYGASPVKYRGSFL